MKKAFWLLTLFFAAGLGFAQKAAAQTGTSISDYTPQEISRVRTCVTELFQDCPQYTADPYLVAYLQCMARMEIKQSPAAPGETFPLLSAVALKSSKCSPGLARDAQFVPLTFNPFKYALDFTPSTSDRTYRVDNTNYIIVIKKTL